MINRRINALCYIVLIFVVKIRLILGAQQVTNSTSNQSGSPSTVQPRFSDLGAMGFPNFGSGRFGNPTSNYPTDSFFPFGNQNNNMQRPGLDYQNQNPNLGNFQNRPIQEGYPNQQGYPYQGNSMYPSTNYQRPLYPNGPNGNQGNFPNGPSHGGFGNRPIHGGFGNQNSFPNQGDNMNHYPNYQRPLYPNRPNDVYPGTINRPNQNEGLPPNQHENVNQQRPTQGRPGQFQYFPQDSEYPPHRDFQSPDNQNVRPDPIQNPSFRPDNINNLAYPTINFPNNLYQNQPNQYDPQTGLPNQNNQNFRPGLGQPESSQLYPSNYDLNTYIQYPADISAGELDDPSTFQFPNTGGIENPREIGQPPLSPGNFNKIPPNKPQAPDNEIMDLINNPNYNNTVSILGKPVMVAPTTKPPGNILFDNSTESPTLKKCIQDCQATSEYNPVCGSNNVTYVNPGKFVCARNCGEGVYLQKKGRCDSDAGFI